jgi:hypothetical protein
MRDVESKDDLRQDTVDGPLEDQRRPFEADGVEQDTTGRDRPAEWQDNGQPLAAERLPVDETVPPDAATAETVTPGDNRVRDGAVPPDVVTAGTVTPGGDSAVPPDAVTAEKVTPGDDRVASATDRNRGADEMASPFADDDVERFRARWRELQADFVDDPQRAVREAGEVVDEVMRTLTEHRQRLAGDGEGRADTEDLRIALRGYRSFLDGLLPA